MKTVNRSAAHNALKAAALAWFKALGIMAWPNELKATYSPQRKCYLKHPGATWGVSDILGITGDGRIIACECKTGSARLTPEQSAFLDSVQIRRGVAIICRSIDDLERAWNKGTFERRMLVCSACQQSFFTQEGFKEHKCHDLE